MADYSLLDGENSRNRNGDNGICLQLMDWNAIEPVSGYSPPVALSKKLLSEFIGSFLLVIAAAGSSIMNDISGGSLGALGTSAASGVGVTVVILATGHISGAHINCAVTLAFATFKHFPWLQVPMYIVVQLLGSIAGAFVLKGLYHPDLLGGVTVPAGSYTQSLLFEILLTAILMFIITSVATDTRAVGELAGIAVGLTVFLDILLAGNISGASMNPVRTLGPAVAANNFKGLWIYFVGPIVGAQIGAGVYTLMRFKDQVEHQRRRSLSKE